MNTKGKIKVIKKRSVTEQKVETKSTVSTKASAREMVTTVSNWVSDFQSRRRQETRQAVEKFFSQQIQTNGV